MHIADGLFSFLLCTVYAEALWNFLLENSKAADYGLFVVFNLFKMHLPVILGSAFSDRPVVLKEAIVRYPRQNTTLNINDRYDPGQSNLSLIRR